MLTRRNTDDPAQQGSQSEYYANSLLQKPGYFHSAFDNLAAGFATPPAAAAILDKQYAQSPEGQAMTSALSAVELENETPGLGWPQKATNTVANMVGYALNPMTYLLGGVGGLAARGVVSAAAKIAPDAASIFMRKPIKDLLGQSIGKYIPSMVGKEGAEEPLSASLIADKSLHAFGNFAGFSVPQAIVDNYEQDTSHIKWGGVAREAGEMGALGIAIGSLSFAWGVVRGKLNRGLGKEASDEINESIVQDGVDKGHITPDEANWYEELKKLEKDPSNKELYDSVERKGTEIINKNGHTASTVTNEALFEILTPENMKNLQGVIADQLAGDVPERYKTALSDFIVHNRLDEIRQNPKDLDGVRGYVDFINQKLEAMPSKIAEADKILDDYLEKGVKENMPLSQKELFKKLKGSDLAAHVTHLPLSVPENVIAHLKQLGEIKRIERLNNQIFKDYEKTGNPKNIERMKQNEAKIKELQENLTPILSAKEELLQLRKTLLAEKGLPANWEYSPSYHRLIDLSAVSHNARTLLDRVHLEHEYNRQTAFRDLSAHILKVADSDMGRLAKPDSVIDYMKSRIEGKLQKIEPISETEKILSEQQKVPTDADAILNEQELQIQNTKAETAKEEFVNSTDKFKEFKQSESIFKNFISCVIGGLSGQGK
jgi:hypothetical protein